MAYFPTGDPPLYPTYPYWSIHPPIQPMWSYVPYYYSPITYTCMTCMGVGICTHKFIDPSDIEEVYKNQPKLWGSFEKLNRNNNQ